MKHTKLIVASLLLAGGVARAAGYWNWDGGRHVWVPGHYIEPRPGYRWVADRWDHRGPRYHYEPGHWER